MRESHSAEPGVPIGAAGAGEGARPRAAVRFRRARVGALRVSHHPDLRPEQVVDAIAAHRRNEARGRAACEKWSRRSSVSRVHLRGPRDGIHVAVKRAAWRGWRGALSDSAFGSRAARALVGADVLARCGVRTPEPLAFAERRRGGLVIESFLITRFALGSRPLPALLPALAGDARRRRALAHALGELLGALHARGADPRDLKPSNLLVGPGDAPALVDADALAARGPLAWSARVRALGQLEAYARDLAPWLPRSDRMRFLHGYAAHVPGLARRRLAREVDAVARRRLAAWAARPRPGRGHHPLAPRRDASDSGLRPGLRIALVHPRAGDLGGVERQIHELAVRLVEVGCEVHYFCQRRGPGLDPAIHFHRVPDPLRPLRFARVWLFDRQSRRALARRGPFDLVCGFGKTSRQDVYRDGSGCLDDFQAQALDPFAPAWRRRLRRAGPRRRVVSRIEAERYRPGGARRVIAISQRVRDQILRRYALPPELVEVLYPGVDLARFHPGRAAGARADLRAELGIPERAPLLVLLGHDYRRKGLPALLAALRELPTAHLLVVGRERCRRLARERRRAARLGVAERAHFAGPRRDPERCLAASDCLVLPTRFDAFGNAVLEAMACGLPVVVSRRAGAAELVLDGKTGRVIDDPDDPAALAEAVRPFLDAGVRREAGRLARATAERHSWDRHFARVLEIFRELTGDRDAPRARA